MPGPDAVFHASLARISSLVSPSVRVGTGVRSPASLNYFAALVAGGGIGKSTAANASADLVAS